MKVLRFKCSKLEWAVPLEELSLGIKRMLRMQWHEFINSLDDSDERDLPNNSYKDIIAILERSFGTPEGTTQ